MYTYNVSQVRQNLAATFDKVVESHIPALVTRQNKEPVVILSRQDYRAMEETIYLMQSAANAERLNRSIAQLEAGEGTPRELIDP
jgi:antitoxin YefM